MRIKMRRLKNLPVFDQKTAQVVGRVERAVVGEDFKLAYVIITRSEGGRGVLKKDDFSLGPDALAINSCRRIKPYLAGEELPVYKRKLGDAIFDHNGRELGIISDFILASGSAEVEGIEISSGTIQDMLAGREEIPLDQIEWRSRSGAVARRKGSDKS
ncbi:MAG: hypothetical protein ACM3PE_06555 [Deltaproteobacteria bacterium]